jgi:hypothetical protein
MTIEATPAPQAARALDAASLTPSALASSRARAVATPWVALGAVMAAAVSIFWAFEAMPFMDLPAHAGLIAMRHRFEVSAFEQHFFVFAPHIGPYSLFRFLGEAFVRVIGPSGAVRALATLPAIATPAALLFARRRLHGDTSTTFGYFGIILSFGLMTIFGFASYLLGMAVLLVGLTLWLDMLAAAEERSPSARTKELIVAAFAPFVFVAHGHAFVLFLALSGVACLAAGDRFVRLVRLRALIPGIALAAYVAWIERGGTTPAGSVAVSEGKMVPFFQGPYDKLSLLITPTLMTRSGVDALIGLVVWCILIAAVIATIRAIRGGEALQNERHERARDRGDGSAVAEERARRHSRVLLVCMACIGALFLALPHSVGWFGFVDGRLAPLILLLGLMAIQMRALGPTLRFAFDKLAPVLAGGIIVVALVASYRFQGEARGYREVLANVPASSRLLNLPIDPNSDAFTGHPFVHYDKLVLADRPIVVSDVWFHQGSALYPRAENPALHLPSDYVSSDLRTVDWPAYPLQEWDFVLVRTRPNADPPRVPASLALVEHRGGWWLYRSVIAVPTLP